MNINRDKQQTTEKQNERKDENEDAEPVNKQQTESFPITDCSGSPLRARESGDEEDTEDDEDGSLHIVSSVRKLSRTLPLVNLAGTHTTATTTESLQSVTSAARMHKHVSFEQVIEELVIPTPSTSKVVENVREYVKQIESRFEDVDGIAGTSAPYVTSPQPNAAQIIDLTKETLTLDTIMGASELSFTSKPSEESGVLDEIERIAHDEVERIVAENLGPTATRIGEQPDFHQVERENQEIAERFRQIMEMFDSFTKNLESLEMPAIRTEEEVEEKVSQPLRRRLSFKGLRSAEPNINANVGTATSGSVYNELYLEVHGARKDDAALTAVKEEPTMHSLAQKSYNTPSCSTQPQKLEAALDPKCRDIATTVSGLELLNEEPTSSYTTKLQPFTLCGHDRQSLSTIGCQTSFDYCSVQMTPSTSASFHNVAYGAKDYTHTNADIVNALIIDSITDAPTTSTTDAGANSFTDCTDFSDITVTKPKSKIPGTTDQTALVKIREPPTIIDLTHDSNVPRVTSVVTDATGVIDAPCERTYHTIHIEANSSPSSSELRRPPLCSRLWNVITDFCAAVCLCLQVNKDCLFCLGFFIAFVVSASFLTAFFYRTLIINPHLLQVPAAPSNIVSHASAL